MQEGRPDPAIHFDSTIYVYEIKAPSKKYGLVERTKGQISGYVNAFRELFRRQGVRTEFGPSVPVTIGMDPSTGLVSLVVATRLPRSHLLRDRLTRTGWATVVSDCRGRSWRSGWECCRRLPQRRRKPRRGQRVRHPVANGLPVDQLIDREVLRRWRGGEQWPAGGEHPHPPVPRPEPGPDGAADRLRHAA
ncbi:hypothetical protein ACIA5G_27225 [Amycolatopsis sp. NPDC051758]|uniref:hypothetical protein n=1 Tax=Amycolatopsis sp. NPDC051758 TaxID=3363935 RepID=UPI0037964423